MSARSNVRPSPPSATAQTSPTGSTPEAFDRRVLIVAGVLLAVLMALSPWYGFHRDELYFLDAGRHLQLSYVDQPILTPLLARVTLDLFGVSLPGLRLWAALAAAGTVWVAGLTARELGGSRRAQLIAAVGVATMPVLLADGHLMGPTVFDMLAWAALAWLLLRLERTADPRLWVPIGLVLGLGVANKHSIAIFAVALLVGVVLSGGARHLATPWFALGSAIALAFTVPDVVWQAQHGWATVAMTRQLNEDNGGVGAIPTWIVGQLLMTVLVLVPVWILGIGRLWRSGAPFQRALVWAYALLFVLFMLTTGSKIYYLGGAYVPLLAAGALTVDGRLLRRGRGAGRFFAWVAVFTAVAIPLVLPVLPVSDAGWDYPVNQAPGESVGWPDFVATVNRAWRAIPPAERTHAVIYAADYGEAGAITELGRADGLPAAVSAHNTEWWWGPGDPNATTVLAIAPGQVTGYAASLRREFGSVRLVATVHNSAGIRNQEWDGTVYLCTLPRRPWGAVWPLIRHYD